jgi:hypothetical protein
LHAGSLPPAGAWRHALIVLAPRLGVSLLFLSRMRSPWRP